MTMLKTFHYLTAINLDERSATSDVEVLRVGKIFDRDMEITGAMLEDYVRNFKDNVYGVPLQVNLGHAREGEAAGWIEDLFLSPNGESLMMRVAWTELGREKIAKKLYKFVSAELAMHHPHHADGTLVDNVFIGAALTNTPAMKDQNPVGLSEDLHKLFTKRNKSMFAKLLAEYGKRAYLSSEDKALFKTLLSELSEEEQAKHKAEAEKIAAKPEEAPAEEGGEGEEEGDEDGEGEGEGEGEEEQKLAEKKKKAKKKLSTVKKPAMPMMKKEEMSEKVTMQALAERDAQIAELKEKIETKELSELVDKEFMLSEKGGTGFFDDEKGETRGKVLSFMKSLNEEQRATFKELLSEVRSVQTGTKGYSAEPGREFKQNDAQMDKTKRVISLSEKLLKEGKAKDIREAQDMALRELGHVTA